MKLLSALLLSCLITSCKSQKTPREYPVIIRHGMIYDGIGGKPFPGDVAIQADTIAAIGDLSADHGKKEIDATGLAVAPGFINMLSWADGSLLDDGRSMSDILQGVTLEVFGEGLSPGPKRDSTKRDPWRTLGEYFNYLQKKGSTPNFASFVGATTVRSYVLGLENRKPDSSELKKMKLLVQQAMEDGAMGVGSSLIYAPADFASTEELIELCKVASAYQGMYITHLRDESDRIYMGLNEAFRIASEANIPIEIYHLKVTKSWNWKKVDTVIAKIDSARKAGLTVTANMYPYNASSNYLTARLPTWVQAGGDAAMRKRLAQPAVRKKVLKEMELGIPSRNSDPKDVLVIGFRRDSLNRLYRNKRLDEIARHHGKNGDETVIDLILADKSKIPAIFFLISEENVKKMIQLPYVSIGSDAGSRAAEKPFTDAGTHPRLYGTFARFLGRYVRDEKLMSMEEGIRRMTSLPASNLKIMKRGSLQTGNFADLAIFDPLTFQDHATIEDSHRYATGMMYVFVNGTLVVDKGLHTGSFPGRCVRGPGWKNNADR